MPHFKICRFLVASQYPVCEWLAEFSEGMKPEDRNSNSVTKWLCESSTFLMRWFSCYQHLEVFGLFLLVFVALLKEEPKPCNE